MHSECKTPAKRPMSEGSPFSSRRVLGGVPGYGTPVLGRSSDTVSERQLTEMRRREVNSPEGSPLPVQREEEIKYNVENSVISGWLKFRDNSRWKSRWGYMTKLSPVADCIDLQLYGDTKELFKKDPTKVSLSLQQFLGCESGFTLDNQSHTIAIICQDVIVVLAFDTREMLLVWQVKFARHLGSSKNWLVMIGSGSGKIPAGPARLHLQERRIALVSGVPPRLLGLWELTHLRRYGVVGGRFCFEACSHSGKVGGLHVLITDQAQDITNAFDAAAHGTGALVSRKGGGIDRKHPDTRLPDLNVDQSIPDTGRYEQLFCPPVERRGFDVQEESSTRRPWSGADNVTLERCSNCARKLGATTRSATVALTPGALFNPAWTIRAVPESSSDNSSNSTEYLTPRAIKKSLEASQNKDWTSKRPTKPARLVERKAPAPLPVAACSYSSDRNTASYANNPELYENYDVPKTTHEVEYGSTSNRIKRAVADDLFQVTKNSAPGNLILEKNCGCISKFGSKKKPVIVKCGENKQPVESLVQKVTNWAKNLIRLPYFTRSVNFYEVGTKVLTSQEEMALCKTIDIKRYKCPTTGPCSGYTPMSPNPNCNRQMQIDCSNHDCCKSSDSEKNKTEGSVCKDVPHLRNKHRDNAQIKRSSRIPSMSGANVPAKSSSAEAEIPDLPPQKFKGILATHRPSGTSGMSDYIEFLPPTSSHSSSDNPNLRLARVPTTKLRPRSDNEYRIIRRKFLH